MNSFISFEEKHDLVYKYFKYVNYLKAAFLIG